MGKIAVFDSGLGGLTVLSELRKLLPNEDYIYYGDSANAPYGDKTPKELARLGISVCRKLAETDDIKCFVVACNTTTSEALDELKKAFPQHDFIGIEPALKWAVTENKGKNILVLATTATINGRKLKKRLGELKDEAHITALPAPGIVPYVESDRSKEKTEAFMSYLNELLEPFSKDTDCVVLGCTHFPFVKAELKKCFEKDVVFYDAAVTVALEVKELLKKRGKLNETALNEIDRDGKTTGSPGVLFLNSDPSKIISEERLLNEYK